MRGEGAPSPIYEGEDSVIAWMLDGPKAHYQVPLPAPGEAQARDPGQLHQGAQRGIPVAGADRPGVPHAREDRRPGTTIEKIVIHTSHHTHYVIGTGANDPQKMDPKASRETLDHSIMYIFAVALQDGTWHHVDSYAPKRAGARRHGAAVAQDRNDARIRNGRAAIARPIRTSCRSAGASRCSCATARSWSDEMAVANAHPLGAKPFGREDYIRKFLTPDGRHHQRARGEPLPGGGAGRCRA